MCASCARSCAISGPATATWRRAACAATCNVSVRRPGGRSARAARSRTSIRSASSMQAIEYEARRQIEVIEEGGTIGQETRLFDAGKGVTRSMRSKEEAHDYRYFPDPDLLPLVLDPGLGRARSRLGLPELPDAKKARFIARLSGSRPTTPACWWRSRRRADFYETASRRRARDAEGGGRNLGDRRIVRRARTGRAGHRRSRRSRPADSANCSICIADGTISGRIAKDVFADDGRDRQGRRRRSSRNRGLRQVTDTGAIEAAIDAVLAANADKVAEYRAGKDKLFGFFVGQVMKATRRQGQPRAGQRAAEGEARGVASHTVLKLAVASDWALGRQPRRRAAGPGRAPGMPPAMTALSSLRQRCR